MFLCACASPACRMEGVGEVISDVARLPAPAIVLVNPGVACETAGVFKALGLTKGQAHMLACLCSGPPELWRNDLTAPALAVQPVIAECAGRTCSAAWCLFAVRMSGSGATCFGLARSMAEARCCCGRIGGGPSRLVGRGRRCCPRCASGLARRFHEQRQGGARPAARSERWGKPPAS